MPLQPEAVVSMTVFCKEVCEYIDDTLNDPEWKKENIKFHPKGFECTVVLKGIVPIDFRAYIEDLYEKAGWSKAIISHTQIIDDYRCVIDLEYYPK